MRRLMDGSGEKIEVLVTDDDGLMRELLAERLSEAGYRVRHTGNGATAFSMLRRQRIGTLITDRDRSECDATRTLARRAHPILPVIAISGGAEYERRSRGTTMLTSGAVKALANPFERRDLLATFEALSPGDNSGAART